MNTLDELTKKFVDDQNGLDVAYYCIHISADGYTEIHVGFRNRGSTGFIADWEDEANEHVELLDRNEHSGFEVKTFSNKGYSIAKKIGFLF